MATKGKPAHSAAWKSAQREVDRKENKPAPKHAEGKAQLRSKEGRHGTEVWRGTKGMTEGENESTIEDNWKEKLLAPLNYRRGQVGRGEF